MIGSHACLTLQAGLMLPEELLEIEHITSRPCLGGLQGDLEFVRSDDGTQELLRVQETVLRARDEHEALDLEKVGELRRVDLPNADGVGLLVSALDDVAEVGYER